MQNRVCLVGWVAHIGPDRNGLRLISIRPVGEAEGCALVWVPSRGAAIAAVEPDQPVMALARPRRLNLMLSTPRLEYHGMLLTTLPEPLVRQMAEAAAKQKEGF